MKKIVLLSIIVPILASAQIGEIKTHEKPGEFIWHCVYHDKPSDTYYLHAQSDNQFEKKTMELRIGSNATEAVKSLANFHAAFSNAGSQFELGECTFIVATSGTFIRVLNKGGLEYTAGNYYIQKSDVQEAMVFLISHRGAEVGTGYVYADNITQGKLRVWLNDYAINVYLNFKTNLRPYLSRKYKKGELFMDADVCALSDAIDKKQILSSKYITTICMQILSKED